MSPPARAARAQRETDTFDTSVDFPAGYSARFVSLDDTLTRAAAVNHWLPVASWGGIKHAIHLHPRAMHYIAAIWRLTSCGRPVHGMRHESRYRLASDEITSALRTGRHWRIGRIAGDGRGDCQAVEVEKEYCIDVTDDIARYGVDTALVSCCQTAFARARCTMDNKDGIKQRGVSASGACLIKHDLYRLRQMRLMRLSR